MRSRPLGPKSNARRARTHRFRLAVEAMEARQLLTTFVVMNVDDSGAGSLRQAILDANTNSGTDTIDFNITGGTGVPTIAPLTPLPAITDALVIDGTTQPGSNNTPGVELSGASAGASASGLTINAQGVTVRGMVIDGFSGAGIAIGGSGGNTIQNNYLGTDPTGTIARPNDVGILVNNSPSNVIGGTTNTGTTTTRNLISGNTTAGIRLIGASTTTNLIQGNFIGTALSGESALANGTGVVIAGDGNTSSGARNNTIGGTVSGARNVISGNTTAGITITDAGATGNNVQNDFIGTNASGTAAVANGIGVQLLNSASSNTIGGTLTGALNVISGNTAQNVLINASNNNLVAGNNIGTNQIGDATIGGGNTLLSTAGVAIDSGSNNTIGGTTAAARNLISGIGGDGVVIDGTPSTAGGASNNSVQGNLIGINGAGLAALANSGNGVLIRGAATNNTIGGASTGARNVISGNRLNGIAIVQTGTNGNLVQNNLIGLSLNANGALANGQSGVVIDGGNNNTIGGSTAGVGNTIANSTGAGVYVASGVGNSIRRNSIFRNGGLGIDLGGFGPTANDTNDVDGGANNLQNLPVLTNVTTTTTGGTTTTTVTGTLNSVPNTQFTIEFFSNEGDTLGNAEARTFQGSTTVTTDVNGNASFSFALPTSVATGTVITSTATNSVTGDTSEISAGITNATPAADLNVQIINVQPNPAAVNGTLTYTIVVGNLGPVTATNLNLVATLPANVTFLSATSTVGSVTHDGSTTATANVGTLAAGATATMTVTVAPTSTGSATLTATATATESDPNPANSTATVTTTVVQSADLTSTGIASPNPVAVGSQLTYYFSVTNNGPPTASAVTYNVVLPAGAGFVSAGSGQSGVTVTGSGNTLTYTIGDLALNESRTLYAVITPNSTGNITATGTPSSTTPDAGTTNNVAIVTSTVQQTVTPPVNTVPPTVTSVGRTGFHDQKTLFTVAYSEDMNASTAEDLGNYTLVAAGRDGVLGTRDDVPIDLRSAVYDTNTRTVTLTPIRRSIPLSSLIRLTISGTSPRGVTNSGGIFLDGNNDGQAGGDYTTVFHGYGSGPNGPQGGQPPVKATANAKPQLDGLIIGHASRNLKGYGRVRTAP